MTDTEQYILWQKSVNPTVREMVEAAARKGIEIMLRELAPDLDDSLRESVIQENIAEAIDAGFVIFQKKSEEW